VNEIFKTNYKLEPLASFIGWFGCFDENIHFLQDKIKESQSEGGV